MTDDWDCGAYGPEGRSLGALCFVGPRGQRVCGSAAECSASMAASRRQLFRRINELAAGGDPTGEFLAEEFKRPSDLLGGDHPQ